MNPTKHNAPSKERIESNAKLYNEWSGASSAYFKAENDLKAAIQSVKPAGGFLNNQGKVGMDNEKAREVAYAAIAAYEAKLVFDHLNRLRLVEQATQNDIRGIFAQQV